MSSRPRLVLVALALPMLFAAQASLALTYVWSGGGTGGAFGAGTAWNSSANWVDTLGNPIVGYPDDLTDVALINRSGTPYFSGTAQPAVVTPATPLTVGDVRVGQAYASSAKLTLGADLTGNKFYFENNAGIEVANFGANTVRVQGTGAVFSAGFIAGGYMTVSNATVRFEGSGTLALPYGTNWGDLFVGDTADDIITLNGPYERGASKRLVFGPGAVTLTGMTGVMRDGTPANDQYVFEHDPAGTVTGPVDRPASDTTGLRVYPGDKVIQPGNHSGIRLMTDHWTGGSTFRLDGVTTLGDLDLNHSDGRSDRKLTFDVDLDANSLTVAQNLRIGQRAELILRNATAHFDDVLIDYASSQMTATHASISVSGNWDSRAARTDPNAGNAGYLVYLPGDELALGTSGIAFTGIGKTIQMYAAGAGSHQTIFDIGFNETSRYTLLSDVYSSGGNILVGGNPVWIAYLTNHGILTTNGYRLIGFTEVPEPAAACLLALAGAMCLRRRRSMSR